MSNKISLFRKQSSYTHEDTKYSSNSEDVECDQDYQLPMDFEEKCADKYDDVFMDALEDKEIFMYNENTLVEEIIKLKIYLEEAKLVEEVLKKHVLEKEMHCENLKLEIMGLRKKLEKTKSLNIRFAKGSDTLE